MIEAPDREGLAGERDLGFVAKVWSCVSQRRPRATMSRPLRLYSVLVLGLLSLCSFSVRWSYPSLQGAGLQCSSCGHEYSSGFESDFQERCTKYCLPLTDIEMGLLVGPAISLSAMVSSIPIGWMADRSSRARVLLVASIVWVLGAFASSFAGSFVELLLACILLGLGQGAVNPCSFALLGDYFSASNRGLVFALFGAIIYLGYDVGILSAVVSEYSSWRIALWSLSTASAVILLPLATLLEPQRGMADQMYSDPKRARIDYSDTIHEYNDDDNDDNDGDGATDTDRFVRHRSFYDLNDIGGLGGEDETSSSASQHRQQNSQASTGSSNEWSLHLTLRYLLCNPAFGCIWMTGWVRLMAGYALGAWMPAFYIRMHGLSPATIATWMSLILLVGGITGSFIGGAVADWWVKRNKFGRVWLCLASGLFAIPFMVGMLLVSSYITSFACLFGATLFAEMWFGPALATVTELVRPNIRSTAIATYLLTTGLGGISAVIVAAINVSLGFKAPFQPADGHTTTYDPTYGLLLMVPCMYALSCVGYGLTALAMRITLKRDDVY